MLEYTEKTCKDLSDFDNAISWVNETIHDYRRNGAKLPKYFTYKRLCARLSKLIKGREKYISSPLFQERGW